MTYRNPKTGSYTIPVPRSAVTGKFIDPPPTKGKIIVSDKYPSIEEIEDAISGIYQGAAKVRPGVTMNHEAEPLRGLWAMADARYEREA